jgi:hypothetical protein
MVVLRGAVVSVVAAFGIGATAGWLLNEAQSERWDVVRPPMEILTEPDEVRVWGAWNVQAGYVQPGTGAIEIRCFQATELCIEAEANLLKHLEGQDLTSAARVYRVSSWTDELVEASEITSTLDCARRQLSVRPQEKSAIQTWQGIGSCEADPGRAVLEGDPL